MFAWVLRFVFFGLGNPGDGLWLLILSMLVFGVAFDFFKYPDPCLSTRKRHIIFVPVLRECYVDDKWNRSYHRNSRGAVGGESFTSWQQVTANGQFKSLMLGDWQSVWFIFAGYALVVAVLFAILFRYKHVRTRKCMI